MQEKNEEKPTKEQLEKEAKALEKFENERQEILNAAVSGKIDNTKERVAYILNHHISARNSDIKLAWIYWASFERSLFKGDCVNQKDMLRLTKISSLTRIRAKLQNEYKLFQANDKVKKFRGVLEESKKQEAIEDRPYYPLYTIFIDETGKTQKYLSVGSLWITDAKSATIGHIELRNWKEKRSIDYEFHFAEMGKHKLYQYKAFFLQFLSLLPSIGFKVITVNRSGFRDINSAITDLTFHLINNGIKHEDESGRAPLPRMLQVYIDNEEKGSDKLKLENLKERIESQQIEGLVIDSFEAVDSKNNIYLQAVDLFISSINRKLHNPEGTKPKDELANYILGLLGFNLEEVNTTNSKIDKCKVFNLSYQKKEELVEG